ncbi:hypothetical protein [Halorientalis salina]|uniref:hypothetical protein n=1 Tax=Halorientalis salina TaxID=2932266 RepID=UPI002022A5FC|nr:hypothetical protein [Halorientalis salina]
MDGAYDPAEASHRALRGIQQELERHPVISSVRGFPSGEFTQVVADVAKERLRIDGPDASLTVRWFAGETADAPPEFSFHYSDGTHDFGWHHEPNPHVDGWGHFQERTGASDAYTYDPHTFSSKNPTRVVWEVMSHLTSRLEPT